MESDSDDSDLITIVDSGQKIDADQSQNSFVFARKRGKTQSLSQVAMNGAASNTVKMGAEWPSSRRADQRRWYTLRGEVDKANVALLQFDICVKNV